MARRIEITSHSGVTGGRPRAGRARVLVAALVVLCLGALTPAPLLAVGQPPLPAPLDCEGPAPDAEPGTPEWAARDAANMRCAQERHVDQAQHPTGLLPGDPFPLYDPYRLPARHDGVRFRYDATTIAGLAAEVYRPCAAGMCPDLPDGLRTHEPPYPAVVTFHGGLSNKQLHWWSSQALAEAGYLVIAYDSAGRSPVIEEAEAVFDWLHAREEPLAADFDGERVGVAGHSAGGVLVSRFGQTDPRVDAVVSWDRAQSTVQPDDIPLRTPLLFLFADYNCQQVPVCQPEPHVEPPDPDGPGDKGEDFKRVRAQGTDTMQVALRAALHLDWTLHRLAGSRWAEATTLYFTRAWLDRYVRGATEPEVAEIAYRRLTERMFDDSADRHNISQGFYDPARAAAGGDLYAGNVPYSIGGKAVSDRLSFYYRSKCFLTDPSDGERVASEDVRADGCGRHRPPDRTPPHPGAARPR
jgi:hypothetical protein